MGAIDLVRAGSGGAPESEAMLGAVSAFANCIHARLQPVQYTTPNTCL